MVFDFSVALTWILFLALFPIGFFWLRRAWRILLKRDFSEVGLKRGVSPPHPEKFAPFEAVGNLIAGTIVVVVIAAVIWGALDYATWSAIAGSTIWCKFFFDFALSRHAHSGVSKPRT
jgi:ABC-type phosphate transport system permease subunit